MLIDKRLICGREVLVLDAETTRESDMLKSFARPDEPLVAEIRNTYNSRWSDMVIRKEKDQCTKNQKP